MHWVPAAFPVPGCVAEALHGACSSVADATAAAFHAHSHALCRSILNVQGSVRRPGMTSFFVVPSFAPPTLEQLTSEPDEVSLIVAQESKIHQEVRWVPEGRRAR